VYLRPGDTFDLPEGHLQSEEVRILVRDGSLSNVTKPKPVSVAPAAAAMPVPPATPAAVTKAAGVASEAPASDEPPEAEAARSADAPLARSSKGQGPKGK
jgi:hypothetical protein